MSLSEVIVQLKKLEEASTRQENIIHINGDPYVVCVCCGMNYTALIYELEKLHAKS